MRVVRKHGPSSCLVVCIVVGSLVAWLNLLEGNSLKITSEEYTLTHDDFVCEWCGKDVMMLTNIEEDMDYITLHGPHTPETLQLCRSCYITALQALQFGKEITQDCQTNGKTVGKRIYVAVEKVEQQSELVNALIWPDHPLAEHVKSAQRRSTTYRVSQD